MSNYELEPDSVWGGKWGGSAASPSPCLNLCVFTGLSVASWLPTPRPTRNQDFPPPPYHPVLV